MTHLYSNIQTNNMGTAVISGFGQVADLNDVREYFMRGKEISMKILVNTCTTMIFLHLSPGMHKSKLQRNLTFSIK
ncbi:hypothetical protein C1N70_14195 [Cytobacillus firmus]